MKNNRSIDKGKLTEQIMRASGGKIDRGAIEAAAAGDTSRIMQSLSTDDRKKLSQIINNPAALAKIMSDPAMRGIIEKLSGGDKNG